MATAIGTTEYSETPKDLTPEYEVEKDGRAYLCRMVAYRGLIYEMCRTNNSAASEFERLIPEAFIESDDPAYDELSEQLDEAMSCGQQSTRTPE